MEKTLNKIIGNVGVFIFSSIVLNTNQYYKIENRKCKNDQTTRITISTDKPLNIGDLLIVNDKINFAFKVEEFIEKRPHLKRSTPNCIFYNLRVKRINRFDEEHANKATQKQYSKNIKIDYFDLSKIELEIPNR